MHNEDAEVNFFGVVSGAMFRLPTDVSPTPSPSVGPPSPNNGGQSAINSSTPPEVSVVGVAFGGVAALLAALVAIVFLAPTSRAADAVRYVASGILGGASAAASSMSPKRGFVTTTSSSPLASSGSYGAAAPSASSGLLVGSSRL